MEIMFACRVLHHSLSLSLTDTVLRSSSWFNPVPFIVRASCDFDLDSPTQHDALFVHARRATEKVSESVRVYNVTRPINVLLDSRAPLTSIDIEVGAPSWTM